MGSTLRQRLNLLGSYARGETERVPGPTTLMVETTVRCNLTCPMCIRTLGGYPQEDMPDELLWPLLEQWAALGGDHVYLYGLGEPLLDGRIFDALRRCRQLGLGTILSTNGTLLDSERGQRLLDAGCDHLLVGMDGTDHATWSTYRPGGSYRYETVRDRVKAFAAEKNARGSSMTIAVQFIRMPRNVAQVDAFVELWRGVPGVDLVRVKEEDIGLPGHQLQPHDGHLRRNPCHILWRGPLVVRWSGDVYTCFHFGGHGEPLGNLRTDALADLWNGAQQQHLRGLHVGHRSSEDSLCATCPCVRPRRPYVLGAMALKGTTVRKLLPLAERAALRLPGLISE